MLSKSNTMVGSVVFGWPSRLRQAAPFRRSRALLHVMVAICGVSMLTAPTLATAAKSCSVSTTPVVFGAYRATDLPAKTGRGDVRLQCSCTLLDCVAFSYSLDVQSGGSGSVSDRRMTRTDGTDTLKYQLYSDSFALSPWVGPMPQMFLESDFGSGQTVYIYGRAFAGQAVLAGTYTDGPIVVVTY